MPLKTLAELRAEIDAAVHTGGPQGKITGAGLNAVLQSLAAEITSLPAVRTSYKTSLLFTNGDELVGPDYHEVAGILTRAALSPTATGIAVSVDGGATYTGLPLSVGNLWQGELELPAQASVFYQITFAANALSAGAVLTIEELA